MVPAKTQWITFTLASNSSAFYGLGGVDIRGNNKLDTPSFSLEQHSAVSLQPNERSWFLVDGKPYGTSNSQARMPAFRLEFQGAISFTNMWLTPIE